MKPLPDFYKDVIKRKLSLSVTDKETLFDYLLKTLRDSIITWDFFVDWDKISEKISEIEVELKILSSLLGKDNLEDKFLKLLNEYPKIRKALPILIAVRKNKLRKTAIITDPENLDAELKNDYFNLNRTIDEPAKTELLTFFKNSGLKEVFRDKKINDLVDYCTGVEVGMDTNARKNRTGKIAEHLLEEHLSTICSNLNLEYMNQATKSKISTRWGYNVELDKTSRRFDFAVYSRKTKKLAAIEVNYYSGGGSKLKATAGEYRHLENFLTSQDIKFIWVTDGKGWNSAKKPLKETFLDINYTLNFQMIRLHLLQEILKATLI